MVQIKPCPVFDNSGIGRVPGALEVPGEERSQRDGRDGMCLRMVQAELEGKLWKGAQAGFSRLVFCRGCLVSCATSDEMFGISSEHLSSAWPQTASSSCLWGVPPSPIFLLLFGPFPSWGRRRGVPTPHLLPSPRVTPCPKSGSSAVPSCWNRESGRLLPIAATSSL